MLRQRLRSPPGGELPHPSQPGQRLRRLPPSVLWRRERAIHPPLACPRRAGAAAEPEAAYPSAPRPPLPLFPLPLRQDPPEAGDLGRARIRLRRLPARPRAALPDEDPTNRLSSREPPRGGPDRTGEADDRGRLRLEAGGGEIGDGSGLGVGVAARLGVGAALGGILAFEDHVEVGPVDPLAADGDLNGLRREVRILRPRIRPVVCTFLVPSTGGGGGGASVAQEAIGIHLDK